MRRSLVLCLGVLAALTASAGFYVDDDVWVDYQDGNDGFTVSGNEATIVWAPMGLSGKVTVPGTLEGGGQAYTVTSIEGAFYDCTRITEMILPESVRTIGEEAFVNCAAMTAITLPSGLAAIGDYAFEACAKLKAIELPAGVGDIAESAFCGCRDLTFSVAEGNGAYKSVNGGLFDKSVERLIRGAGGVAAFTVPETVTSLGAFAFDGLETLTLLHFQGGVPDYQGYPDYTFNATITQGTYPAAHAEEWKNVLQDGKWRVELTEDNDDEEDWEAWPVPHDIAMMPHGMWLLQSTNAKWLTIGGTETCVCQEAAGSGGFVSEGYIISKCSTSISGELEIPAEIDGIPVVHICFDAFKGCAGLTKVAIPASCVSIASGAFGACGNVLFEVAAGNTAFKAVDGALLSADGTRLLAAPGNVADYAVPEGVQTIDDNAFAGRPRLTSVSLPASLRAVQPGAFLASAAKVSVDGANPTFWASDGGLLQRDVSVDGTVWETLLHVPTSATQYVVPDGVSVIGDHAFTDCSRLTAVTLPAAEERLEIAATAFEGCGALRTVTFRGRPAEYLIIAVEAWPDNALGTYPRLWAALWQERLGVDGTLAGLPMRQAAETGAAASLQYGGTADAPTVAALAASASGALVIPYGVAAIEPGALADCRVSSVTVPGSVKTLGPDTFVRNASLATVTLERGVEAVQAGAFDTCNVLTKVVVPDTCTEIDPLAFEACPEIAFEVAAGNPSYASDASGALLSKDGRVLFVAPGNVSAYTIPAGVETIAAGAFAAGQSGGRVALGSVTVPATVTDIALGAFAGFGPVTVAEGNAAYASRSGALLSADGRVLYHVPNTLSGAYTVPEGVVEIAAQAFQGCAKLSALTVPATVDVVGSDALAGCADMAAKSIVFLGEPPTTVAEGAFAPCAAATYPKALWREWAAVITDGTWNGLAMTTTPFSITLKIVGAGSLTDSLGKKYTAASTVASYQPAQAVTLTATPGSGSVFLGWSGEGLAKDGASASFIADGDVTFTAHFVTQQVADSMEAVGVGGDGGASLEEALANGEVVRREDIPDLVKEMAFGAPVIEVGDETLVLEIGLQRAETLGDWEAMGLQTAETAVTPDGERLRLTIRKPEGSSAAFYKFVVPDQGGASADAQP